MTSQPSRNKTLGLNLKPSRVDLTCRMFKTGRKVCAANCTPHGAQARRHYCSVDCDVDNEKKCVRNFMVTIAMVEYARASRGVLIV